MPAETSFNSVSGVAELVLGSGLSAWHGMGTVFPGLVSRDDAIKGGMPFTAVEIPLILPSKVVFEKTGIKIESNKTGQKALLRSDTAAILGIVGDSYEALQPSEMFDFAEGVNVPGYETAGGLRGGSVLFLCAPIGEINVLGSGDITRTYLTFINSFDGSLAAQVYLSGVRVVCMNTLMMSLSSKKGAALKFKHTKSIHDRLKQASLIMDGQQATEQKLREALEKLAARKLKRETYENILDDLFPGDSTRSKNVKADVTSIFADNDGNQFPDFKGTAYNLYNAVTNYVDHDRNVRITANSTSDNVKMQRFESALIGSGAELKTRALERILVLSDGSEENEFGPIVSLPPKNITPRYQASIVPQPTTEAVHGVDFNDAAYDFPIGRDHSGYEKTSQDASQSPIAVEPTDTAPQQYIGSKPIVDASEPTMELFTTATESEDNPGTTTSAIVEVLPSGIQVRRVNVPESLVFEQLDRYKQGGFLAASKSRWDELQRQKAQSK